MKTSQSARTVALVTLLAGISPSLTTADIPVRQVLIESRIVVTTKDFARDLGVRFAFQTPDQGLDLAIDQAVEIWASGGFNVEFDKKFRGSATVRVWCYNGQIIQTGKKSFKSHSGGNKNIFRMRLVTIDPAKCPLPLQIQPDIKLKGKQLETFVKPGVTSDDVIRLSIVVLVEPRKK